LKQKSVGLPSLKYLVKITAEAVYDQSVGPNAGKCVWQVHLAHFGGLIWPTRSY